MPPISQRDSNRSTHYEFYLGSVRDLIDSSGTRREHINYDTFGNVISETDYDVYGRKTPSDSLAAVDTLFGYTGREWDEDAEFQFNRARWYDPEQGHWLSQDPIGFAAGDANLYRYVGNGSTTATDPSGLAETWGDWCRSWFGADEKSVVFYVEATNSLIQNQDNM